MARRHVKDLGTAYCGPIQQIRSEEVFPGAMRWLTPLDWQQVAPHSRESVGPVLLGAAGDDHAPVRQEAASQD